MSNQPIINFYEKLDKKKQPRYVNHDPALPQHPFRLIACGPSGSGKTNSCINIIAMCDNFNRVIVCAKNIQEPLYTMLKSKLNEDCLLCDHFDLKKPSANPRKDFFNIKKGKRDPADTTMVSLDEIDKYPGQQLILFDDMVTEDMATQRIIKEFFLRGRKANSTATEAGMSGCSCIYLSQSYFGVPKFIRLNSDHVIIKKMCTEKDLGLLLKEYGSGVPKDIMFKMVKDSTKGMEDFFYIDSGASEDQKYRKGFYECYDVTQMEKDEGEEQSESEESSEGETPAPPRRRR
jgi:hypothetical protein